MDEREAPADSGAAGAAVSDLGGTASGPREPPAPRADEASGGAAETTVPGAAPDAPAVPDAAAEPAESGPGAAEAEPVPRRRRWPKIAAALGAAAAIGAAGAAVLLAGGGSDTLGGVAAHLPTAARQVEQPPPDGAWGRVGDPVSSGSFEFTVTGVHTGLDYVGGTVQGEAAQGSFVVARLTVRNVGEEAAFFTDADQRLADTAGARHRPDSTAGLRAGNPDALFGRLAPGEQVRGGLVFDVPPGSEPAALHLKDFTSADTPAVVRLESWTAG
ncbi:DUF4352 domain-containing protein [Streptomonospora wellingtoniae]|uniref:DUF4352 domain-containing protein n=1 Tax=Streptomonospora wellingtoniae TaxID=3075544 RepID=A0ABU2KX12_9ACTN|nr:DUF4352 domain-containing protein [Streptomonospora sp. DSM 45055]MDT0303844.1 DUF4352 domain-containing protein [Streptomonospora sp. DSM 45055]